MQKNAFEHFLAKRIQNLLESSQRVVAIRMLNKLINAKVFKFHCAFLYYKHLIRQTFIATHHSIIKSTNLLGEHS
jgi:hypothetical protein